MLMTFNAVQEMPMRRLDDGRYHPARPVPGPFLMEVRDRIRTAWYAILGSGVLVLYGDYIPSAKE